MKNTIKPSNQYRKRECNFRWFLLGNTFSAFFRYSMMIDINKTYQQIGGRLLLLCSNNYCDYYYYVAIITAGSLQCSIMILQLGYCCSHAPWKIEDFYVCQNVLNFLIKNSTLHFHFVRVICMCHDFQVGLHYVRDGIGHTTTTDSSLDTFKIETCLMKNLIVCIIIPNRMWLLWKSSGNSNILNIETHGQSRLWIKKKCVKNSNCFISRKWYSKYLIHYPTMGYTYTNLNVDPSHTRWLQSRNDSNYRWTDGRTGGWTMWIQYNSFNYV